MSSKKIILKETEKKKGNSFFNYLSVLILAGGVVAFYVIKNNPIINWSIFAGSIVLAFLVFFFLSTWGISLHSYFRDSFRELQKVVWPNRQDATKFTFIVFAFVVALGLFVWLVDTGLSWVLYNLILGK